MDTMNAIVTRLHREFSHFTSMPKTARRLTVSYFLRSVAFPMLSLFTGAFIWKTSNDITLLTIYYLGNFLALPIMFSVNARLLRHFTLPNLYLLGTIISGFGPLMVMFQRYDTPLAYIGYGFVYGIGNGLYWANRNYLTLTQTTSQTRSYFTGLSFTLSTLSAMVVPPIAGWFVVYIPFGYKALVLIASGIFISSGLIIRSGTYAHPDVLPRKKHPLSAVWQKARLLSIAIGCVDSVIYIVPTVLILSALGNEVVLGWVNGMAALFSAAASYIVGRKYRQSMFTRVFTAMLIGFAASGLPLFWGIGVATVSWYLLVSTIVDSVIWIANEPVLMDMMDDEVKHSHTTHYRLVIERERFLNIGRIGMLFLLLGAVAIAPEYAMAIAATICGIVGLGITGYSLYRHTPQSRRLRVP